MAVIGRPILGIDIGPSEICVVEMRGAWPDFQIVRAGKTATPNRSVDAGRILDAAAIASAIRALLDELGIASRDAVLSIAECCVVTRVLDIPAVPANELRTVIEGELAHYQILGNSSGAFDFMTLAKRDGESEGGPQALVMAAEEQVVAGYRAVAEMAGLNLTAMEPTLLACYRAGFQAIQSHPVAACLAIGRHESEITVTCNGQIRLYRRIDIGRDTLMLEKGGKIGDSQRSGVSSERVPFGELADEPVAEPEPAADQPRVINPSSASSLTVELQRSLDYFASQSPDEATIDRLVLAVPVPELAPLETWFTQAISIETVLAVLPAALQGGEKTDDPESVRYLCAAGLAMRELAGLPPSMPRFDLSSQQRNSAVVKVARRTLTMSLGASAATLALGTLLALQIGLRANHVDHDLAHLKIDLKAQEKIRQDYITSVENRQDLLRTLRVQGFPFPRIMDSVCTSVPEKTGLTAVGLDGAGKLTVNGDANDEKQVISMLENLRKIPYFESVSMDNFDKQVPTVNSGWLVRFQISCQLTTARAGAQATASAAPIERRER
jgi:type IV pilus assembly protein PilM